MDGRYDRNTGHSFPPPIPIITSRPTAVTTTALEIKIQEGSNIGRAMPMNIARGIRGTDPKPRDRGKAITAVAPFYFYRLNGNSFTQ